jgi:hypothetical protein
MMAWKLAPWLSRLVILAVAGLFAMIGVKFVLDPLHAAANAGITIEPGLAYTSVRAGFGGFPLGFAAILLFCLVSPRRHGLALGLITTVGAAVLAVRLFGAAQDATFAESAHIMLPEAAIVIVALLAMLLERRRAAVLRAKPAITS